MTGPTDLRPQQLSRHDLDRLIRGLRKGGEERDGETRREIPRWTGGASAPLSSAQERLWFLDRLEGSGAYHVAAALEAAGHLCLPALARAFAALVARHEPLRTRFRLEDGEPVQEVVPADDPAVRPPLPVIDLSRLPEALRDGEGERVARAAARRPFDLGRAPLLHLAALRAAADRTTLVVVFHHIVSDGWSLGIIVRELGALYGAELEGGVPVLGELPVRYVDFAAWERARLTRGELDGSLAFWRRRLEGLEPLDLPTDRPRPARRSGRGRRLPVRIGAGTARRVGELARSLSATRFAVLLAAFQAWLGALAGRDDLAVGVPAANRARVEAEPLVGLFVNTLVLRADLSGEGSGPSFGALVERTAVATEEALRHQELPLERLVAGANPLFRVLFTLQNAPRERLELPGVDLAARLIDTRTAKLDLALSLVPEGDAYEGTLEHDADLFDRGTARRLGRSFLAFLDAAVAEPERPVRELPLAPDEERRHALHFLGTGPEPRGPEEPVPERIAVRAGEVPEAVAVVAHGPGRPETLTYRELLRRADALARQLRRDGLGPERRVGLLLPRSTASVASLLGVLRAGAVAVPLDPESPPERLAGMAEDARLALLLAPEGGGGGVPGSVPRLDPEAVFRGPEDGSETPPLPPPPAEAAAYVVFTSGSTGRPKGVAVDHRALADRLRWNQAGVGPEATDAVLHKAPSSFDFSLWEILAPLAAGARVVLAAPGRQGDPGHLRRRIARERVTIVHFVPPLLDLFVAAVEEDGPKSGAGAGDLASLRRVLSGGDVLAPALRDRSHAALGAVLCNQYGPTEGTIDVTLGPATPADGPGPVPIGPPGDGVRLAIADRGLRPMPVGVPGELLIAGRQVARGYEGRPAETAERYVPDPFQVPPATPRSPSRPQGGKGTPPPDPSLEIGGGRLYRTGDRAVLRADGRFVILGRLDRQVKVRGYRIEPGEVEAALRAHPAVRDCVAGVADGGARDALAAWVVPAHGEAADPEALRKHLSGRLPPYMVPDAWAVLPELPRTASGKLDRRAVTALATGPAGPAAADALAGGPPRTATERLVARTFAEVLGLDAVGRDAGFLDLGGHSLLAGRVAARLERRTGREVPLRLLFEERSAAAVAAALDARAGGAGRPAAGAAPEPEPEPAAERGGDGAVHPLSPAQRRLWFLHRYDPRSPQYNMAGGVRVRGAFRPAPAAAAVGAVAARHDALRTVFREIDGEPVQRALDAAPVPLPVVDLSRLPAARRGAALDRIARAGARVPFDLESGPVLRTRLVRLAADDHALLAEVHHIVSDGWSVEIFLREVAEIYRAGVLGRAPELPELPVTHGALAARLHARLEAALAARDLDFWRRTLAGAPTLDLPSDRPRPPVRSGAGATLSAGLPPATAGRLRRFAARAGATPYAVLLAAWAALLSRYAGQDDVVIGTPVAGRDELETEPVIGFFVQTLPVRIDLSGRPGYRALVERTAAALLAALGHRKVPFEKLVEELVPERDPSRTPLFQVVLGTALAPGSIDLAGARGELVRLPTGTARWDLVLSARLDDPGPDGSVPCEAELDTALFDPATVERMVRHLGRLLDVGMRSPETPVEALPLLDGAERAELLAAARGIEPEYSRDAALWPLFEARARETPDAVALDETGGAVTYGELRRRSAGLGRRLLVAGTRPADRVALVLTPSGRFVEALLGVLAAGAVYVPLDPSQPEERLAAMLADSGARVVLADAAGEAPARRLCDALADSPALLRLDGPAAGPATGPDTPDLPAPPPATAVAHVMFTSGSTGRPKGVMVTHRAVARLVLGNDLAEAGPGDRVGGWANGSFDASTWEIFLALLAGATWVGVGRDALLSPARLAAELALRRVTLGLLTTAVFDQVAAAEPAAFRGLDRLLFGGEAASAPSVRRVIAAGGPGALVNIYGPTECSVVSTQETVGELSPDAQSVPIGRPIAHTTAHVVDRSLRRVPVGVAGELVLGGDAVVAGYQGRPAATAERFVPDPFAGRGRRGGRLYRTGDLARRLPDGALDFSGRFDDQVKIRGVRVEPGEVEEALAAHPGVARCAVIVDGGRSPRLVAYAVPVEESVLTPGDLRGHLRGRLPAAMVPAAMAVVESLPVAAGGKVDRRALRSAAWLSRTEEAAEEAGDVAPRNALERSVARVLGEVLETGEVGAHDDFFDLGGHSLLAHRVVSRLREAHGVELPLRSLFEDRTVAGIAGRLEALGAAAEGGPGDAGGDAGAPPRPALPALPGLPALDRTGPPPHAFAVSYAQERLWFLDRLAPGSARYNVPVGLRLSGRLSPAALAGSLTALARRHEALRTRFREAAEGEDLPVQVIDPPAPVPLPVVDLSGLPEAERRGALDRLGREEAARPFDLGRGPLLRAALVRLAAADHALFLDLHHIVFDGWSAGVLVRELGALYPALADGRSAEQALPGAPVQYADYAAWQRRRLDGGRLAEETDHWRERLSDLPPLDLPSDRPRPARAGGAGATTRFEIDPATAERVRALALAAGTTQFAVFTAALEAMLLRYTGQRDFGLGTPVANRQHEATSGTLGFFVNTLVLRSDLREGPDGRAGTPSFRELVHRVRATVADALDHQDLPFERLVEELAPERDPSRSPLFQVAIGLVPDLPELALPGIEAERIDRGSATAKFDWAVHLYETGAGRDRRLAGVAEHRTDLFETATAERMVRHFRRLLAAAVGDPETPVDTLPLVDEAERRQLLARAGSPAAAPAPTTLPRIFARVAAARPDAVALAEGAETVTYGELDRRSAALAARLAAEGVAAEVPVALLLERSVAMVVATLAALRAGGWYVPLEPSYPPERLGTMLATLEGGRPVVVSTSALLERFPGLDGRAVLLDRVDSAALPVPGEPPEERTPADPDLLCYAMFTSGSTGVPKAVGAPHGAVDRLIRGSDFARLDADEVLLHLAPTAFDAATLEIWGALLTGGRLEILPAGPLDLAQLGRRLRRLRVTTLWLTAGLFHRMVEDHAGDLADVRQVLTGGDVVSPGRARQVLERVRGRPRRESPGAPLSNAYGPTESTTFTTCHPLRSPDEATSPLSIGRPVAGRRVVLCDWNLRLAADGVPAELCVAGDGLARGYLGRPGRTAESFVPHPEPTVPGERLYRTGDLARWRSDGTIEFLGRRDHQVKIRGFRVEPGEVELAVAALPGVARAGVVVHGRGTAEARLVAFVAFEPGAEREVSALRAELRRNLPEPMLPSRVVALDTLPLDPNGKLDRRALLLLDAPDGPAPADAGGEGGRAAPRTPTEAWVASVFRQALELDADTGVGRDDDFFDLGGHSLLADRVVSRLRRETGLELPLRVLFESRTVAGVAAALDGLGDAAGAPPLVALDRSGPPPHRFAPSYAQERLWFLDRLDPGSARYNVPLGLRLRGALSPAALAGSLTAIVRRHEALRTRFEEADPAVEPAGDGPVQVIDPPAPVPLPVVDLSGLSGRAEAEAARIGREEAGRPFDLAAGPLLRAALVRLGAGDHVLVLDVHHIVFDGWSLGVLVRELAALYPALAGGGSAESVLPEPAVQYADYADWQRRWLAGERLDAETGHWRERLCGLPPVDLPADRPRPPRISGAGGSTPLEIAGAAADGVRSLAASIGTTPFAVLTAALEAMVLRYTGQRDFGIGTPVANRRRDEIAGTLGFFVNTLVLRSDLREGPDGRAGAPTFRELVTRVRATVADALDHQDLPFERLVEELSPVRDPSRPPLFQVALGMPPPPPDLALPGFEVERIDLATDTAKFDWAVHLYERAGGFTGVAEHNADLFDRTTAARMAGCFRRLVAAAVAAPDTPVGELPLMGEAERRQLLVEWAGVETAYPRNATVPGLFRRVAAARPEAVAVADGERALTYGELERRSRRLAALLRERGVGPEVPVALLLERSADQVTATLAVLRAGGYYVPLEPGYPRERLVRTLGESAAPLLVAEGARAEELAAAGGSWSGEVARLDELLAEAAGSEGALDVSAAPEGLCYVMYTSGSTGRPKGVAVPHRGVVRLVREPDFMTMGPEETFLELAPTAFDLSTLEMWGPLLNGGRLEVMTRGPLDLRELGRVLVERRVSSLWMTAGLFHQMVEERISDLDGVRQLLAGGDVLSPPHVRALLARRGRRVPGARVIDGYGPTENTTFTTCHPMASPDDLPEGSPVPIGRPIADGRVVVLDAALRPVPLGVPGELCAAGDGLARGYQGWPSRTAETFVPHPEAREPGERLYRIGDLARWRPDGTLEFLGRRDRQVKIRGFRIEPGEVEIALRDLPEVASGAVVVRGRGSDAARLIAWVVPAAPPEAGPLPDGARREIAAGIARSLREVLPAPMVPEVVALADALPLDPNGKIDRRVLAALDPGGDGAAASTGAEREHVPPRTPAERLVAAVFEEVLGVGPLGAGDDFFDRGGHSLKATRVVSRLRARSGVDLPVRALFEAPTVAGTAARLEALEDGAGSWRFEPRRSDGPAPLSYAQERLWILDRIEPGSSAYGIPVAVRLRGPLDPRAFDRALTGVVERHESLRTTFVVEAGRPVQLVHPPGPPPVGRVDLSGLPPDRRAAAVELALADGSLRPFELSRGPLLRALLLLEETGSAVLQVTLHHIVADGWSLEVLVREVAALYRQAVTGEPAGLAALPIQYADFAAGQRRWLTGEVRERQLAYWRETLDGAPPGIELPLDRPRPAVRSFRGERRRLRLPEPLVARLRQIGRDERATLFMVLLAAFEVVLHRLAGEDDVVVGTPVAGRDRGEVEGLIGMFLNTLVLRTDLSGAPSFRGAIGRVRETVLGAFAHQDVPFEMLIDALRPERDLSRTPFFQVFFNMLEVELEAEIDFADVDAEVVGLPELPSKFDLTLYVRPAGEAIDCNAVFNADLFDGETIERVLAQYLSLLEQAAGAPARPVAELSFRLPADRAFLPDPGRPLDDAWRGSVSDALVRAARETPDRIALSAPGATYSYRALEAWSAAVARRLAGAGVGRGDAVAIHVHRRPSLAAAVHGVLRAGGAFLNLDPSYPPARIAATVAAAGARVVLRLAGEGPDDDAWSPELEDLLAGLPGGVTVVGLPARPGATALAADASEGGGAVPPVPVCADDAACVTSTSSSTGEPKVVVGRHGSLTHFLPWLCERFGLGPDDRFTLLSGLAHDPLQRDLFTPLWLAAPVVLPEPEAMVVPERLRAWLAAERATAAVLTPAMAQVLTERMDRVTPLDLASPAKPAAPSVSGASGARRDRASLRRVFLVGDALTRADVERLWRLAPGVACVNTYGATETQRALSYHELPTRSGRAGDGAAHEVMPLGRGMAGCQLLVLAPDGGLAGVGEVGEIAVRSPHLARGYLGRPARTAERFLPAPASTGGLDRIYRTGDLGRFDAAGEVRFLGRADQQVKVRGFRIELGEVTARVAAVPGVREAAVLLRTDGPLGARLTAYVVPEDAAREALAAADLREPLRRLLPGYMVPASYVFLDRLPLTPNRKLDRRALLALDDRSQEVPVSRNAPTTEAETKIAAVVQEVLGLEVVGPEENFFDLGGNSMLLIQVHGRLQEVFEREIPMVDLFSHTTVRSLAGHLTELGVAGETGRPAGAPPRHDREEELREGRARLRRRRRAAG